MLWTMPRYHETDEYTLGYIAEQDRLWHTLELPWRQNQRNVSRIPAGRYSLRCVGGSEMRVRLRNEWCADAAGASDGILSDYARFNCDLHIANYVSQLQGCIAVGWGASKLTREESFGAMVTNSKDAMTDLRARIEADTHPELLIVDRF